MTNARPQRERLPRERKSITHKFSVGEYEGYVTAGMYDDGRLGEVFLTDMGKEGSFAAGIMGTWAKTFSVALQWGVPLEDLIRKYVNVRFDPGPTQNERLGLRRVNGLPEAASVVDYIARWLALKFGSDDLKQELRLPDAGNGRAPADEPPVGVGGTSMEEQDQAEQREVDQQSQEHNQNAEGATGGEQVENRQGGEQKSEEKDTPAGQRPEGE